MSSCEHHYYPKNNEIKAREQIAFAIAELLALKAENDRLHAQYSELTEINEQHQAEYFDLQSENHRLQAQLDHLLKGTSS